MRAIERYAIENSFDPNNNFATACYDSNSIAELETIVVNAETQDLDEVVDWIDCSEWGITSKQWIDGIRAALKDKKTDFK